MENTWESLGRKGLQGATESTNPQRPAAPKPRGLTAPTAAAWAWPENLPPLTVCAHHRSCCPKGKAIGPSRRVTGKVTMGRKEKWTQLQRPGALAGLPRANSHTVLMTASR